MYKLKGRIKMSNTTFIFSFPLFTTLRTVHVAKVILVLPTNNFERTFFSVFNHYFYYDTTLFIPKIKSRSGKCL